MLVAVARISRLRIAIGFRSRPVLVSKGFVDHFPAYPTQKRKCDPVIHCANFVLHREAKEISNEWHDALENAETQRHLERMSLSYRRDCSGAAERHRDGVHGKGDSRKQDGEGGHSNAAI
jgi:hypothetical protein